MRSLRVGVSACLLGERVRYDGDHRRDGFVVERLGRWFTWVPVCPEVEAGFGIPRETLRLLDAVPSPAMIGAETGRDRSAEMRAWAQAWLGSPQRLGLCGFVLKRGSPSCGPVRVKLYPATDRDGTPQPVATGLFARALLDRFPGLPVTDETILADRRMAAEFLYRVRLRCRMLERGDTRP